MEWTALLHQKFLGTIPIARGRPGLMLADWVLIPALVAWGLGLRKTTDPCRLPRCALAFNSIL